MRESWPEVVEVESSGEAVRSWAGPKDSENK